VELYQAVGMVGYGWLLLFAVAHWRLRLKTSSKLHDLSKSVSLFKVLINIKNKTALSNLTNINGQM